MAPNEFTVVDGVPKAILGEGLKVSGSNVIHAAMKELFKAAEALERYCRDSSGGGRNFPKPEKLNELVTQMIAARDHYLEQWEIGQRAWRQGCELIQEASQDDSPPPPVEVQS